MVLSLINCCIVGMVISYIKQYLVGTPGRFRTFNSSLLRRVRLPLAPPGYLEVREGFEPSVLGICSPLHWASLPPYYCYWGIVRVSISYYELHKLGCYHYTNNTIVWLRARELNPVKQVWSLRCYRNTCSELFGASGENRTLNRGLEIRYFTIKLQMLGTL